MVLLLPGPLTRALSVSAPAELSWAGQGPDSAPQSGGRGRRGALRLTLETLLWVPVPAAVGRHLRLSPFPVLVPLSVQVSLSRAPVLVTGAGDMALGQGAWVPFPPSLPTCCRQDPSSVRPLFPCLTCCLSGLLRYLPFSGPG